MSVLAALAAIAVLALLIVVHELGHFTAARVQGIYANRFSIGFGPILWKYQGSQTEYAIRAFPLGGFVGFPDDDPDSTIPPDDPNLLKNRPILDRAIVISAGVIANLIFAYLILLIQVGTVGIQQASEPGVLVSGLPGQVSAVAPPASEVGIKPGDSLFIQKIPPSLEKSLQAREDLTLNESKNFDIAYSSSKPSAELLTTTAGSPLKVVVNRKDENGKAQPVTVTLTPQAIGDGKGQTGIQLVPTAAIKAGLRPGDTILSLNGKQFGQSLRSIQTFQKIVRESLDKPVQLTVNRDGRTFPVTIVPEANPDNEGSIGVGLSHNGTLVRDRVGGFAAFGAAAEEFQNTVNDTVEGFVQLIRRFSKVADQVAGPVAIVAVGAKIAQSDAAALFQFAALISINLAIINILPLPALDGGHLAFLLIEGVRGKPLPTQIQDGVMQTGLMLLLGLGIFLIIRDTANLIPQ